MERKFQILSGLLKAYESEDGTPRLKTTASSTIQDHGKDRMFPSAISRMAETAKDNMTIFLNHSYEVPEDVLGSVENTEIRQAGSGPDGVIYDLDFDVRVNATNPRALKTWEAIKAGVKLGTSIGAIVKDWEKNAEGGWDIKDVELLEASIVGIPANPRSWVHYAVKSLESETITPASTQNLMFSPSLTTSGTSSTITLLEVVKNLEVEEVIEKAMCPGCDNPEGDCSCSEGCECGKKEQSPELIKDQSSEAADELTPEASAQEADDSAPEAAPQADEPAEEATIEASADPYVIKLGQHIESLVNRIKELLDEVEEEREIRLEMQERLDDAEANLAIAKQIVDRIADLPLPRKARMQAVNEFRSRVSGIYGEDFLKMLETE